MDYGSKSAEYFSHIRKDILALLPAKGNGYKVMEIGAAYGETLHYLKETGKASQAVGVDIFEDTQHPERYKTLDRFIFGDIVHLDFPEYKGHFDIILLPDVLEHIWEPKPVLETLKAYLASDGKIIVSMPNIRHYSALKKIFLKGDFRYEESGIFDYTHMRFYCKQNIVELLESAGFRIEKIQSSIVNYQGRSLSKLFNRATFGVFEEFLSYQYFFVIEKKA